MGASRALATLRRTDGTMVYFNDKASTLFLVQELLKVTSCPPGEAEAERELVDRLVPVCASIQAQQDLRYITGQPAHNLGTAALHALQKGSISRAEASALRGLRRKANAAKHEWASTGSGVDDPSALSDSPASGIAPCLGGKAAHRTEHVEANITDQSSTKSLLLPLLDGSRTAENSGTTSCSAISGDCSSGDGEAGTTGPTRTPMAGGVTTLPVQARMGRMGPRCAPTHLADGGLGLSSDADPPASRPP